MLATCPEPDFSNHGVKVVAGSDIDQFHPVPLAESKLASVALLDRFVCLRATEEVNRSIMLRALELNTDGYLR